MPKVFLHFIPNKWMSISLLQILILHLTPALSPLSWSLSLDIRKALPFSESHITAENMHLPLLYCLVFYLYFHACRCVVLIQCIVNSLRDDSCIFASLCFSNSLAVRSLPKMFIAVIEDDGKIFFIFSRENINKEEKLIIEKAS